MLLDELNKAMAKIREYSVSLESYKRHFDEMQPLKARLKGGPPRMRMVKNVRDRPNKPVLGLNLAKTFNLRVFEKQANKLRTK